MRKQLRLASERGPGHLFHLEGGDDLAFWIGDEVVGQRELVFEGFLRVRLVKGDAEHLHAFLAQVGEGVAQRACLLGAAGSVGLRVEEDDRGAFFVHVGEVDGGAVLVDAGDGGGVVADFFALAGDGGAEEALKRAVSMRRRVFMRYEGLELFDADFRCRGRRRRVVLRLPWWPWTARDRHV
jgi:hypothetical protein